MKFFQVRKGNEPGGSVTLWTPWIRCTLSFDKKTEQQIDVHEAVDTESWFEQQMETIRSGKRPHPVLMTMKERHEETAKTARKLKWSKWFGDPHGTRATFEAIREHGYPRGSAVDFLSVLTVEEREELREIVKEEVTRAGVARAEAIWAAMGKTDRSGATA